MNDPKYPGNTHLLPSSYTKAIALYYIKHKFLLFRQSCIMYIFMWRMVVCDIRHSTVNRNLKNNATLVYSPRNHEVAAEMALTIAFSGRWRRLGGTKSVVPSCEGGPASPRGELPPSSPEGNQPGSGVHGDIPAWGPLDLKWPPDAPATERPWKPWSLGKGPGRTVVV